ncbi:MAG: hypothetical protein KGJ78_03485 [Alphaproteobacteria bacterium]|nr:hypothetical protein [Alphaproteobacteria bacterium]
MTAYLALLHADQWLFLADGMLGSDARIVDGKSMSEIRRSIADHLEYLQPRAYRRLHGSEPSQRNVAGPEQKERL